MQKKIVNSWKGVIWLTMRLAAFLLVFFIVGRLAFIVYHHKEIFENPLSEVLAVFSNAMQLDLSTCSYLMGIPVVLYFLLSLTRWGFLNKLIKGYFILFIVVISAITSFELELYNEWGTKLNYKALKYLVNPSEAFNSTSGWVIVSSFSLFALQCWLCIWIFLRFAFAKAELAQRNFIFPLPYLLCGATLVVIGLRGGLQPIPIHQSQCYFSKSNALNLAATNSFWNLLNSFYQNMRVGTSSNPYMFHSRLEARKTVDDLLYVTKDTTIEILTTKRPNVVMVILESWSADLVKYCGGDSGITPQFEALCDHGLLFSNCYASGERSDQGMTAIWSAFPAQPEQSIINQPDKFQHLPFLVNNFKNAGYYTSYMYGGQLIFGNIKGYMMYNKFDRIREGKDFSGYPEGKLGIHDEYLFTEMLKECNDAKQPFINTMFTQSSHSPYDQPMQDVVMKGGRFKPFLNSVYYCDRSIGQFMAEAKKQPWYANTLFIFVADHSHLTHLHEDNFIAQHHKIPMLFYGEVLKPAYKGYKYTELANQHAIAATLLAQLGLSHKEFYWSQNLFNPYTQHYAYAAYNQGGFIWVRPGGNEYSHYNSVSTNSLHYNNIKDTASTQRFLNEGRSYFQEMFQQFLDY